MKQSLLLVMIPLACSLTYCTKQATEQVQSTPAPPVHPAKPAPAPTLTVFITTTKNVGLGQFVNLSSTIDSNGNNGALVYGWKNTTDTRSTKKLIYHALDSTLIGTSQQVALAVTGKSLTAYCEAALTILADDFYYGLFGNTNDEIKSFEISHNDQAALTGPANSDGFTDVLHKYDPNNHIQYTQECSRPEFHDYLFVVNSRFISGTYGYTYPDTAYAALPGLAE